MTVISGKHAYINGVGCLTNWGLSEAVDQQTYASSCTGDGMGVTDGNSDMTGSATGKGHTPGLLPDGSDLVFKGVVDNESGDAIAHDGLVVVTQSQINIPVAAGGPINWSSAFSAQGLLIEGTVGAADATIAEAPSAKLGAIKIAANTAALAGAAFLAEIQNITLTFTRSVQVYISGGATFRTVGPLTATIAFDILRRSMIEPLFATNAFNVVQVTVGTGLTWEMPVKWGAKSGLVIDTETRAPVGYTVNGTWSSVVPATISANKAGWIKKPDDTYFFGVAPT